MIFWWCRGLPFSSRWRHRLRHHVHVAPKKDQTQTKRTRAGRKTTSAGCCGCCMLAKSTPMLRWLEPERQLRRARTLPGWPRTGRIGVSSSTWGSSTAPEAAATANSASRHATQHRLELYPCTRYLETGARHPVDLLVLHFMFGNRQQRRQPAGSFGNTSEARRKATRYLEGKTYSVIMRTPAGKTARFPVKTGRTRDG